MRRRKGRSRWIDLEERGLYLYLLEHARLCAVLLFECIYMSRSHPASPPMSLLSSAELPRVGSAGRT